MENTTFQPLVLESYEDRHDKTVTIINEKATKQSIQTWLMENEIVRPIYINRIRLLAPSNQMVKEVLIQSNWQRGIESMDLRSRGVRFSIFHNRFIFGNQKYG